MYTMSDGAMARTNPLPPLQFGHRSSGQSTYRRGTELAILVNLTPNSLLTELEHQVMNGLGLDGHWLIVAVVGFMPGLKLDLSAPGKRFEKQLEDALNMLSDLIFNDIVAGFEADGMDDLKLANFDVQIVEDMPTIMSASETILVEVCNVLRNYSTPSFCQENSILKYILGYSLQNPLTGCLHFHFADYENYRPLRL